MRFLNLESTFHEQEGYPAAESGGTWAMAGPGHNRRCDFNEDVLVNGVKVFAGSVLELLG